MKMKRAIIHISDLHISSCRDTDGEHIPLSEIQSFFTTDPEDNSGEEMLLTFIKCLNEDFKEYEFSLIVTGDIADSGKSDEYERALTIFNRLVDDLQISKNRILLIPGDHDVNRIDCQKAYSERNLSEPTIRAHELHNQKFEKFKIFWDEFFQDLKVKFDPEQAVCGIIQVTDDLVIIGLNSNFKVGTKSSPGFIESSRLERKIKEIKGQHIGKIILAAFHHNFEAKYEDKSHGAWDNHNLHTIKSLFEKNDIRVIFYGNEHISFTVEEHGILSQSAVGSLSKKGDVIRTFKVYEINTHDGLNLDVKLYNFQADGSTNLPANGYWNPISHSPNEKITQIIISKNNADQSPEYKELKSEARLIDSGSNKKPISTQRSSHSEAIDIGIRSDNGSIGIGNNSGISTHEFYEYQNVNHHYSENLFNIVKENKLFHSGHFHWSNSSRSHNWIDITKILNDFDNLVFAKNAIMDLVDRNIGDDFDFIIGLGIEGNILSTRVAIKYNKPYSFLPYSYRYDDHNEFEKDLCFENKGQFKRILIITDVVNDGRTIRKLIQKRGGNFFQSVESIVVVSLFYTGDIINPPVTILNLTNEDISRRLISGDHPESRIKYYFVLALKVEKCPYGEDYRTSCLLMNNPGLGCIHKFYDEEKSERKRKRKLISGEIQL